MRLSITNAVRFPYINQFLNDRFPHIVSKQTIIKPFRKWSAFTDYDYDPYFFQYGKGPTLDITDDYPIGCHYNDDDPGKERPAKDTSALLGVDWARTVGKDTILIFEKLAALTNQSYRLITDRDQKNSPGDYRVVDFFEAVLMHELIHWSFYRLNKPKGYEQDHYKGDAEYGTRQFEMEAYGHITGLDWRLVCYEDNPSNPFTGFGYDIVGKAFIITQVLRWSAAWDADLQSGDVIVSADGQKVESRSDFGKVYYTKKPGDQIKLTIKRDGQILNCVLKFSKDRTADARANFLK